MVRKGPLKEHDEWRESMSHYAGPPNRSEERIAASNMQHLVRVKPVNNRRPKIKHTHWFIHVDENVKTYWYGFDDFDEAVLFMLRFA